MCKIGLVKKVVHVQLDLCMVSIYPAPRVLVETQLDEFQDMN